MEDAKFTHSLSYTKGKKSLERLTELEKFGMDPERIKLIRWFDGNKVFVGIHMDNDKAIGNHWVGWVLLGNGEANVKTFDNKLEARDWALTKGELNLRKKKLNNQLVLIKMVFLVILLVLLSIYFVLKVYK